MNQSNVDQLTETQLWPAVCRAKNPDGSWALPGMQEKCLDCNGFGEWTGEADACNAPGDPCEPCHGTGYVAKRDWMALVKNLSSIDVPAVYLYLGARPGAQLGVAKPFIEGEPEQALLRAVAQALVAQGCELGATT